MKIFKLSKDEKTLHLKTWYGWKKVHTEIFASYMHETCQTIINNGGIVLNYHDTLEEQFIRFGENVLYANKVGSPMTLSEIYDSMFNH